MSSPKLAFLGLGVMGYPMAGHLQKAGYDVTVYNRTATKAATWVETYGGSRAATPAAAAEEADIIFACVGNDHDLRQVALGTDGAFNALKPGAIFVDHTTVSATIARELDQAARALGCHFLDAPVSGGQAGAENGALTIMLGGEEEPFATVDPILQCYARKTKLLGTAGSGQLAKMVNQICIAGVVQGLSEGLHFAKEAGLDAAAVIEVISKGAAQSWQMENRAQTMIDNQFDFGFAVDWMRKDLDIVLDEAENNGADLPVTRLVNDFYSEVQQKGGNRWDTSSLITRLHNRKVK
ncbi:NAD(P)-dependent oxidoreductase [Paremcibacter congregatus]|uniref:NAD(P)-dependent oxidoreductase n=1 Tax=Paremcibacter congregatus TaxID=2043170 RepID=UPI0030EB9745